MAGQRTFAVCSRDGRRLNRRHQQPGCTVRWDVPRTREGLIGPEFRDPLSRLERELPPREHGPLFTIGVTRRRRRVIPWPATLASASGKPPPAAPGRGWRVARRRRRPWPRTAGGPMTNKRKFSDIPYDRLKQIQKKASELMLKKQQDEFNNQ